LAHEIPWLPYDKSAAPVTYFFLFNFLKPPFNSVLVRQAFAAAIDREALVEIVNKYAAEKYPATSYTPPEILGRDLYNEVGISFDPTLAKELLEEAGYTDPSKFPIITLLTNTAGGGTPYLHITLAEEMGRMWKEYLGVTVSVEYLEWGPYLDRIKSNPPEIFRLGWAADYNDPDNFLREIFETDGDYNWGNFSNAEFDALVQEAAELTDPSVRQELYLQAERILCETEVGLIPIYHGTRALP
jgi:oligopeptide transport system substrate-binding protein